MEQEFLIIIAIMSIVGLIVLCTFILLAIKMLTGPRRKKSSNREEAQIIQEIFQGLVQMERRVEALETILLDKEAQESNR